MYEDRSVLYCFMWGLASRILKVNCHSLSAKPVFAPPYLPCRPLFNGRDGFWAGSKTAQLEGFGVLAALRCGPLAAYQP